MADTEVDMGRPITCGALAHIMSRESTLDGEQLQLTMRLTGMGKSFFFSKQGNYFNAWS